MFVQVPVDPGKLIVLTVDVIVTSLGASEFVAMGDHRHALGEHERCQEVTLLTVAQLDNFFVIRVALCPAVPRAIVVCAVRASLSVRLVVLFVVGDEITKREPSWAMTKLMDAIGLRPVVPYRSEEPASREAKSGSEENSPRQKSRTVSRYLPFHSDHKGGNPPT